MLCSINQVDMKNYICGLAKSYMEQIIDYTVKKQLCNDER